MAEPDPYARQLFGALGTYLNSIGLGDLFFVDAQGQPGGWLWNKVQQGLDEVSIRSQIEQTDTFRNRFGVIVEQQKRAAKGDPVYVMSPQQVLEYERDVKQIFASAGLPPTFYDEPSDFHRLILADFSAPEVAARVEASLEYVQAAPPEVRKAFTDFYGVGQGEAHLAAWALDPTRTVRDVQRATRTAYAKGMADRYDVAIDRSMATRIGELNMSEGEVRQNYERIAAMENLFTESLGEATDLTQQSGVEAVFEADADALRRMNRRVIERQSINQSATGGAAITQRGVVGAGSS